MTNMIPWFRTYQYLQQDGHWYEMTGGIDKEATIAESWEIVNQRFVNHVLQWKKTKQ